MKKRRELMACVEVEVNLDECKGPSLAVRIWS